MTPRALRTSQVHKPFATRRLRAAIDALEPRRLLASGPTLNVATTVTVPAGKTIQVPVTVDGASDVDFDADASGGINAGFRSDSNPWLELDTSRGTMRFQLFADLAKDTVRRIRGLVEGGFYDGLTFNRVVNSGGLSLAQTGSPDGTLAGNPGFTFDDEFHPDALFTGTGQLAMANGGKDANGSQFFVTNAVERVLDFNHTIFGQLVRGGSALSSIVATADPDADANVGAPLAETKVRSARIVDVDTDAVMQIRAGSKTGTRSVVLTATDADGRSVSRTVTVKVVAEANNTPPILTLPRGDHFKADAGETVEIPYGFNELEGEPVQWGLSILENGFSTGLERVGTTVDDVNRVIRLRIQDGFAGRIVVKFGVKLTGAVARGTIALRPGEDPNMLRIYDTQQITVSVGGTSIERVNAPATLAARVGDADALDDAVLATFDSDDDADKDDFSATINWGDGTGLQAARIEEVDDGAFAVVAHDGHAYARSSGGIPIEVTITGTNGSRATARITAVVSTPVELEPDGTLRIRGTDADDRVRLETDDDGTLIARIGGERFEFSQASVDRIVAELFAGDDELLTVDAAGLPPMTVFGGDGNDTIYGGSSGDRIEGGDGHDCLYGESGEDWIYGGSGNDTIYGGGSKNFLFGEDGEDRIVGGNGHDSISGGNDSDRLYGRGGNDTIEGNNGTDRLYGEDGNDRLVGGSSNDRLYGGNGNDSLWGNQGNDTMNGGPGLNLRGDRDDGDYLVDVVDSL